MLNRTEEWCFRGVKYANSWFYRFTRIAYLIEATIGVAAFGLLVYRHKWNSPFHRNLKVILFFYNIHIALYALASVITEFEHVYAMFTYQIFCDLYIDPDIFPYFHVSFMQPERTILWATTAFCVERLLATIYYRTYEQFSSKIGWILIISATLMATLVQYISYSGAIWDAAPRMDFFSPPNNVLDTMNQVYLYEGIMAVIELIFVVALYTFNKYREKRSRFTHGGRYQLRENVSSTYFMTYVSVLSLAARLISDVSFLIRAGLFGYFPLDDPVFTACIAQLVYCMPMFTALVPLQVMYLIGNHSRTTTKTIKKMTDMKSIGIEGRKNYEDYLHRQWNIG